MKEEDLRELENKVMVFRVKIKQIKRRLWKAKIRVIPVFCLNDYSKYLEGFALWGKSYPEVFSKEYEAETEEKIVDIVRNEIDQIKRKAIETIKKNIEKEIKNYKEYSLNYFLTNEEVEKEVGHDF